MKKNFLFILGALIILSGIILGVINWSSFPETIAIHFGANGIANGFTGKITALVLIPVFMLLTHVFLFFCLIKEMQNTKIPILFELLFTLIMPSGSIIYDLAIFSSVYQYELDIFLVVCCFISVIFIICGIDIPKLEKTDPFLSRILGWIFLFSGCLILLFTLLKLRPIVLLFCQ